MIHLGGKEFPSCHMIKDFHQETPMLCYSELLQKLLLNVNLKDLKISKWLLDFWRRGNTRKQKLVIKSIFILCFLLLFTRQFIILKYNPCSIMNLEERNGLAEEDTPFVEMFSSPVTCKKSMPYCKLILELIYWHRHCYCSAYWADVMKYRTVGCKKTMDN